LHLYHKNAMKRRSFLYFGGSLAAASSLKDAHAEWTLNALNAQSDIELNPDDYFASVRELFPLKNNRIFLNNGTMGVTPFPVLQAVTNEFQSIAENAAYPAHNGSLETQLAKTIGANPDEIGITKNVSEGINHICWGIPLKKGDEVLMTTHEHVGGCAPWLHRAKLDGIVIKTFEIASTAAETLNRFEKAITAKTRAFAIPHIPCTIGQILPIKDMCALARSKNIISCVDGAHPLGMIEFNVKDLGCDYYAGCFHKWVLGPIGTGWLYINQERLSQTKITHVAAYSLDQFNMNQTPPFLSDPINKASRYSYGTFSGPLWVGAEKSLELYHKIGPKRIEQQVKSLSAHLQNELLAIGDGIQMLTPTESISRGAQIGFKINSHKTKKENPNSGFVNYARSKNIILRHVAENGLDSIRISTHYYNTKAEIDQCVNLLKEYAFS
jgi:cysteine desulfurase/selenocysteine lyase